jgi:hypothetical protein
MSNETIKLRVKGINTPRPPVEDDTINDYVENDYVSDYLD